MAEVEFRTGPMEVPDHVAELIAMSGADPKVLTYDQAIAEANQAMERRILNKAMDSAIAGHFRTHGGSR